MKGPTRQHHSLAVDGKLTPEPGGAPTSDVFEGKGGAAGNVFSSDGAEHPADDYVASMPQTADPNKRW